MTQQRPLTNDEIKAAEAAFRGRPFDPTWSKASRAVYNGLLKAIGASPFFSKKFRVPSLEIGDHAMQQVGADLESEPLGRLEASGAEFIQNPPSAPNPIISRQEAIDSGLLIDVSKTARKIGLSFAVGITKSLWEKSITDSLEISQDEWEARVRDMLLAVRLRLAGLDTPSPWVQVPVLLAFQENPTPQLFPIYALFHKDSDADECLTLIHPQEISSATPTSHFNEEGLA